MASSFTFADDLKDEEDKIKAFIQDDDDDGHNEEITSKNDNDSQGLFNYIGDMMKSKKSKNKKHKETPNTNKNDWNGLNQPNEQQLTMDLVGGNIPWNCEK